jgi:tetratricopeptide (TPR) repeat protein
VRAAREAADAGRAEEAVQRYESYLATYPDDALRPIAQLGLGRLRLAQGQNAEAMPLFEEVARHTDVAVAERGRFYMGVTRHLMGEHAAAIAILEPLRGRTVDPEETALLLRTLAASALATNDAERAIMTLDALVAEDVPEEDRREAEARLREILGGLAEPRDRRTAVRAAAAPRRGLAHPGARGHAGRVRRWRPGAGPHAGACPHRGRGDAGV